MSSPFFALEVKSLLMWHGSPNAAPFRIAGTVQTAREFEKMLNCSISGCRNCYSEILGIRTLRERWFVGKAEDWPQLAIPGVDKIVLCPDHRREVFNEVLEMRKLQND
jgi:hypothetical protein